MAAPAPAGSSSGGTGKRPPRSRRRGRRGGGGASADGGVVGVGGKGPPNKRAASTTTAASASASASSSDDHHHHDDDQNHDMYRPHKVPLINLTDETPTWYECGRNTPGRNDTLNSVSASNTNSNSANNNSANSTHHPRRNTPEIISKYRTAADKLYQHELALTRLSSSNSSNNSHSNSHSSSSRAGRDEAWVENTMRRGTLKDRIAAMAVVVSSDPVHKLYALDMLLGMVGVSVPNSVVVGGSTNSAARSRAAAAAGSSRPNERVAQMASEALSDLFTNTLLPSTRKLVPLENRPLFLYEANSNESKNVRGEPKGREEGDDKGTTKQATKLTKFTKRTLSPRLLLLWYYESHLKVRYGAYLRYLSTTLSQSTQTNTLTKANIIRTAAQLLRDVPEGEGQLLSMVVNKLGDPDRKVAACAGHELRRTVLGVHPDMVGVVAREVQQLAHRPNLSSRALYNCIIFLNQLKLTREDDEDDDSDEEEDGDEEKKSSGRNAVATRKPSSLPASLINTYFRLFEVAIKKGEAATRRNNNKSSSNSGTDDGTMKGRLLSALLTGVNRAHPYLPRKDLAMETHVDALYRIAHSSPPAASTQAFMLLYNLAIGTPQVSSDSGTDAANADATAAAARKDRLYRALYSKLSDPAMLSGRRQLTMFFNLIYKAMKADTDPVRVVALAKRLLHTSFHSSSAAVIAGTLFLVSEIVKLQPAVRRSLDTADETVSSSAPIVFDPTKRDPRAAFRQQAGVGEGEGTPKDKGGAPDRRPPDDATAAATAVTGLWEVSLLLHHYHPTVHKFASSLGDISYDGDPLRDFALGPFLDRLAYRNPKSRDRIARNLGRRGDSVAERRSGIGAGIATRLSLPVNDPAFLEQRGEQQIGEGEEFFRTFFMERARRDRLKGIVRGSGDRTGAQGDDSDLEFDAIEADEMKGVDDKFEEGWDTDPEEDEFANQLAEKLMESGGNFDDEDPDMEGWSDMEDSSDNDDDDQKNSDGRADDIEYSAMDGLEDDEDGDSSDDDAHGNGAKGQDADAFMDAAVSDDSEEDSGVEELGGNGELDSSDESENGIGAALLVDDSYGESEDENDDSRIEDKSEKEKRKQKLSESFVDASEYEDIIAKGWKDLKRPSAESDGDEENISAPSSGSKRKRKRRKRAKH